MRRLGWTGLATVLALLIALLSTAASASPGGTQRGATLRFRLATGNAVAQPFDRWLGELAGMTALTIESETWKDGEAMRLRAHMGGREAWTFSFLAEAQRVSMESSLMADGAVTLLSEDAAEARVLMAGLRSAIEGPKEQVLSAAQFALIMRSAAATTKRWGVAAAGTEGETCTAVADFLTAFADIAQKAGEGDWLNITLEPEEDAQLTVAQGVREAPAELPGMLAMEAFWSTMRAIAAAG